MGRKYNSERAVSPEEGEEHRDGILAFMADWDDVAKYLLTYGATAGRACARSAPTWTGGTSRRSRRTCT